MGDAPAAIGAVVARPIVGYFADQRYSGICFLHIQAEIRIPFVILQKDVVLRHVAFDQGTFQNKGFKFTGGNNHIKVMDFGDHHLCFRRVGCGILEILADPVFQFFRFAHIDDLIVFVPHNIDARCIGQGQGFFL